MPLFEVLLLMLEMVNHSNRVFECVQVCAEIGMGYFECKFSGQEWLIPSEDCSLDSLGLP
jgi:hypothetical protein